MIVDTSSNDGRDTKLAGSSFLSKTTSVGLPKSTFLLSFALGENVESRRELKVGLLTSNRSADDESSRFTPRLLRLENARHEL